MFDTLLRPEVNEGIGVAFTNRLGGYSTGQIAAFNLGQSPLDAPDSLRANVALLQRTCRVDRLVCIHQVHGTTVLAINETFLEDWREVAWLGSWSEGPQLPAADALVTRLSGVGLAIRTADCVPVLLADARTGVIGAAHAGRVGLLAGVLTETVAAMRLLGAVQITAWVGPHICADCYEVAPELAADAEQIRPGSSSRTSWGTTSIDLGRGAEDELAALGVRVIRRDPCTRTTPQLYSYRAEGANTGRQVGVIWGDPRRGLLG